MPTFQLEAGDALLSLTSTVPTRITSSRLSYGGRIARSFRPHPRALTAAKKSVLGERSQATRDNRRSSSETHRRLFRNEKPATDHKGRLMKRSYILLMGILSISGCMPCGPSMTLLVNPKTGERITYRAVVLVDQFRRENCVQEYEGLGFAPFTTRGSKT